MFNIFTRQGVVEVKTMTIFWSPSTPPRRGWQGETLKPSVHIHFHNSLSSQSWTNFSFCRRAPPPPYSEVPTIPSAPAYNPQVGDSDDWVHSDSELLLETSFIKRHHFHIIGKLTFTKHVTRIKLEEEIKLLQTKRIRGHLPQSALAHLSDKSDLSEWRRNSSQHWQMQVTCSVFNV